MSDYQDKDLEGVLFKNGDKRTETDRDYRGTALIDGKPYWMSAWINTSKQGEKYMKLRFTLNEQPNKKPKEEKQEDFDADVPF